MKKEILCGLMILSLTGCATVRGTGEAVSDQVMGKVAGEIIPTEKGVQFKMKKPGKMTMKDGEKEYTFDSTSESLLSKIVSILSLGLIATR